MGNCWRTLSMFGFARITRGLSIGLLRVMCPVSFICAPVGLLILCFVAGRGYFDG